MKFSCFLLNLCYIKKEFLNLYKMNYLNFIISIFKKIKPNYYIIIGLFILCIILFLMFRGKKKEILKKDSQLNQFIHYYKAKDSSQIIEISELIIKKKELEERYKKEFNELNLKYKNNKHLLKLSYQVNGGFQTSVRDTQYYYLGRDTIVFDTIYAEVENYSDGYLSYFRIKTLDSNLSKITYSYRDSLIASINKYQNLNLLPNFLKQTRWSLKSIFKPWKYKLNAKFENPKAKIESGVFITTE